MDSFDYNDKPTPQMLYGMNDVNDSCIVLRATLCAHAGPSRERSLAITKLEEFSMWANKAITHVEPAEGEQQTEAT